MPYASDDPEWVRTLFEFISDALNGKVMSSSLWMTCAIRLLAAAARGNECAEFGSLPLTLLVANRAEDVAPDAGTESPSSVRGTHRTRILCACLMLAYRPSRHLTNAANHMQMQSARVWSS